MFYNKVKAVVERVMKLQAEIRKKNWKKCTFGEIEDYKRGI